MDGGASKDDNEREGKGGGEKGGGLSISDSLISEVKFETSSGSLGGRDGGGIEGGSEEICSLRLTLIIELSICAGIVVAVLFISLSSSGHDKGARRFLKSLI